VVVSLEVFITLPLTTTELDQWQREAGGCVIAHLYDGWYHWSHLGEITVSLMPPRGSCHYQSHDIFCPMIMLHRKFKCFIIQSESEYENGELR
jgi:hypothetical protein